VQRVLGHEAKRGAVVRLGDDLHAAHHDAPPVPHGGLTGSLHAPQLRDVIRHGHARQQLVGQRIEQREGRALPSRDATDAEKAARGARQREPEAREVGTQEGTLPERHLDGSVLIANTQRAHARVEGACAMLGPQLAVARVHVCQRLAGEGAPAPAPVGAQLVEDLHLVGVDLVVRAGHPQQQRER
jgi:hypothetical protein